MKNKHFFTLLAFTTLTVFTLPQLGFADVEGTLGNIRDTLINRIMPLIGAMGLCFAGFSFVSGNAGAKNHLYMAIFGALIAFGAPSIIDFAKGLVN